MHVGCRLNQWLIPSLKSSKIALITKTVSYVHYYKINIFLTIQKLDTFNYNILAFHLSTLALDEPYLANSFCASCIDDYQTDYDLDDTQESCIDLHWFILFTSAFFPHWFDGVFFFVSTVFFLSFLNYCPLQRWYFPIFPELLITSLSSSEQFLSLLIPAFVHLIFENLHYSLQLYYNYQKYDETFSHNYLKYDKIFFSFVNVYLSLVTHYLLP